MAEEAEFIEAQEDVIRRVLDNVSTSFPATIIAPLPAQDGLVNVQPNHKFKAAFGDEELTPDSINNVVLMFSGRTKNTIIRPPKEALIGSKVLVMACEHDITEWRSSGGKTVYPGENRRFNFNDAVAILGLYPETVKWPNPQLPDTFEILGLKGVKFKIGTKKADLVGLAYQILLDMAFGITGTAGGVPVTGNFTNLAQIQENLAKLLTITNPPTP